MVTFGQAQSSASCQTTAGALARASQVKPNPDKCTVFLLGGHKMEIDQSPADVIRQVEAEHDPLPDFLEVQDTPAEAAQLLAWFGERTELDLKFEHDLTFDMIPPMLRSSGTPESAWLVHRQHGGYNDREWTMVAMGQTPLEAIRAAHEAFCDGR